MNDLTVQHRCSEIQRVAYGCNFCLSAKISCLKWSGHNFLRKSTAQRVTSQKSEIVEIVRVPPRHFSRFRIRQEAFTWKWKYLKFLFWWHSIMVTCRESEATDRHLNYGIPTLPRNHWATRPGGLIHNSGTYSFLTKLFWRFES